MNEAAEADQWMVDYLSADSELTSMVNGVYSTFIGKTSDALPIVRFFLVSTDDVLSIGPNRVWSELVFQVEAVTDGPDSETARSIATRLDELLHDLTNQTSETVTVHEVFRRGPLFRKSVESGDPYVYAGGEYVVRVSAL